MKKAMIVITIAMVMILAVSCGGGTDTGNSDTSAKQENNIENVLTQADMTLSEQLGAVIEAGVPVTVVDARTADAYAVSHIAGALSIPDAADAAKYIHVTDANIWVYADTSEGSKAAAEALSAAGYTVITDAGAFSELMLETDEGEFAEKDALLTSFRSTDIYGRAFDESIFADAKLTMINIWATYCPPCLDEMPDLGEIAEEYAERGFKIIGIVVDLYMDGGIASDKQIQKARSVADSTGADYTHLVPSDDLIASVVGSTYSVPTTWFVDSEGNIVGDSYVGSRDKSSWTSIIDTYLDEVQ